MSEQKLYLIRAKIGGESKLPIFLEKNIVAIGWERLGILEGKSREEIGKLLEEKEYKAANIVIGQINHFINHLKIGDLCLIPDPNTYKVYLAKVISDYYFDPDSTYYPHQYKVEFINKEEPFDRRAFSYELNRALKPLMTVADITHRLEALNNFMQGKQDGDLEGENIVKKSVISRADKVKSLAGFKKELLKMMPTALGVLQEGLSSEDEEVRLKVAKDIVKLGLTLSNLDEEVKE